MLLNIIHLPERVDRYHSVLNEISKQCVVDYKFWSGIIDLDLPQKGISKAHKQVVRDAKFRKLKEVLICEDDILFSRNDSLDYFLKNKPTNFDIYLGGIYEGQLRKNNTVIDFSGLTIYIIKESFYDTFLSIPEEVNLDRGLRNKGNYVACNPLIAKQLSGYSDNLKRYCDYTENLKRFTYY